MKDILLVNDDPIVGAKLKEALEQSKFHVELAKDAASAQPLAQNAPFHLICIILSRCNDSDALRTDHKSIRLAQELRENGVDIPIHIHMDPIDDHDWKADPTAGIDERPLKHTVYFRHLVSTILANLRREERRKNLRRSTYAPGLMRST